MLIDVDEHRRQIGCQDRIGGRSKREGRHQHLGSRRELQRPKRPDECGCAVVDGHGVLDTTGRREFFLEGSDLRPLGQATTPQDTKNRLLLTDTDVRRGDGNQISS